MQPKAPGAYGGRGSEKAAEADPHSIADGGEAGNRAGIPVGSREGGSCLRQFGNRGAGGSRRVQNQGSGTDWRYSAGECYMVGGR